MRLFFALVPPAIIRDQLLMVPPAIDGARFQTAEQLHITIRYIGRVDPHLADMLIAKTSQLQLPALHLQLHGLRAFDHNGKIRQIWAKIKPDAPITRLHKKIDRMAVQCGLEPERRKYTPHCTIARLNSTARGANAYMAVHSGLETPQFTIDRLGLFESHLGHGGSHYESIASWPMHHMQA